MNPTDHYRKLSPHDHNSNVPAAAAGNFSNSGAAAAAGMSSHNVPGSGGMGLFFPSSTFQLLAAAGHKLQPQDTMTLEAMLNSTKQLSSTAPLQLVDFKEGGAEAGGASASSSDQERMMLKRQATRYYRNNSNTMNGTILYDQSGPGGGLAGPGDDMNMQDYSLMDQEGEYDGAGGDHKKLGAAGSGRRLGYDQVKALEKAFEVENRLEPERKMRLASQLGLQPRQVAVWFQNRRARWKTKQMERDYTLLKNKFEALKADRDKLLREKDSLQAELVRLKGKQAGDQDSPTLASCSLVDDAANQAHAGEEHIVENATPDDQKLENDSLSSTEDSDNINGDIEDSTSILQGQTSTKPLNDQEPDFHWKPFNPQPQVLYRNNNNNNNIKNEEWENGEQSTFNMSSMEWYTNW